MVLCLPQVVLHHLACCPTQPFHSGARDRLHWNASESPGSLPHPRAARLNPGARVYVTNSEVVVDVPDKVKGRRVVTVDDGPTLTHGGPFILSFALFWGWFLEIPAFAACLHRLAGVQRLLTHGGSFLKIDLETCPASATGLGLAQCHTAAAMLDTLWLPCLPCCGCHACHAVAAGLAMLWLPAVPGCLKGIMPA
jgi:hypothetical protein